MKYFCLTILILNLFKPLLSFADTNQMSPEQAKQLVKDAVTYALTNKDPNMNYSKYVSKNFMNPIDGQTFNYEQWVTHMKHIKAQVKSMKPTFDVMVAEGDTVAVIFRIHLIKNDNSKLVVKDMGFFKIKDHKIIYVEELTRLLQGSQKDKDVGSTR